MVNNNTTLNNIFFIKILRRIVIPASAFDGKVKFLEKTRKSFGGGTFNISEGALLESYYSFLKDKYSEAKARQYFAVKCIGLQEQSISDYWCLSSEVIIMHYFDVYEFIAQFTVIHLSMFNAKLVCGGRGEGIGE